MTKVSTNCISYEEPNRFVTTGLYDDVRSELFEMTLEDAFYIAEEIGMSNGPLHDFRNQPVTIEDVVGIEGTGMKARSSRKYWFLCGPARDNGTDDVFNNPYSLLCGSILDWLVDCIMHDVVFNGYDVFKRLKLPL